MALTVNVITCMNLFREIEAVHAVEPDYTFRTYCFPPRCEKPVENLDQVFEMFPGERDRLASGPTLIIGGACLYQMKKEEHSGIAYLVEDCCIYLAADREIVSPHLQDGYYAVTPGWVVSWKDKLREWGFTREQARMFFHDTVRGILLVDTAVYEDAADKLEDFSAYVDLPERIIRVGLSHFRMLVNKPVSLFEQRNLEARMRKELRLAEERTANYQTAFEVIQELAGMENEDAIIERFLDFCGMMFAPKGIAYLSSKPSAGDYKLFYWGETPAADPDELNNSTSSFELHNNRSGFTLRINFQQSRLGILYVARIAFPEHVEQYLNFARALSGPFAMAVETARTMQKLSKAYEGEKQALFLAQKANKAKNQFIANISHEIRTPIHGILGMVGLLDTSELMGEEQEIVQTIGSSANILLDLINDIIDISKIEAGRMEVEYKTFDLHQILRETYSIFNPAAKEAGISLSLDQDPSLPQFVKGDPKRLRQILFNLISNAIKFTEAGSVRITAGQKQEGGDPVLFVSVKDTGIGISPEKQHLLFEAFSQVDNSETRRASGSGLGLSITRELVGLLGGDLGFTSEEGKGSDFFFYLPLKPGEAREETDVSDTIESGVQGETARDPMYEKVLVVEDNKINQLTTKKILEKNNFPNEIASDGAEAVERCKENRYSLIIMDCYMPGMDGFAATVSIRRLGGWAGSVPIIATTASALEEDIAKCYSSGMDDILEKPFKPYALIDKISYWCNKNSDGNVRR